MEVSTDVKSGNSDCPDADVDFGAGDPLTRAMSQQWVGELAQLLDSDGAVEMSIDDEDDA